MSKCVLMIDTCCGLTERTEALIREKCKINVLRIGRICCDCKAPENQDSSAGYLDQIAEGFMLFAAGSDCPEFFENALPVLPDPFAAQRFQDIAGAEPDMISFVNSNPEFPGRKGIARLNAMQMRIRNAHFAQTAVRRIRTGNQSIRAHKSRDAADMIEMPV